MTATVEQIVSTNDGAAFYDMDFSFNPIGTIY